MSHVFFYLNALFYVNADEVDEFIMLVVKAQEKHAHLL